MKRPANSKYYEFDTTNPNKGSRGCDCVVRSISLAMNKSWEEVFDDLCEIGRKLHRMPSDDKVFEKYLTNNNWICLGQPRKENNSRYTGKEFIDTRMSENDLFKNEDNKKFNTIFSSDLVDYSKDFEKKDNDYYRISHIIVNIGSGHLSCIINKKFHDIWDPSDYCVGKIWIKK